MSLSPRGLCLGLCWACAGLVLGLWACVCWLCFLYTCSYRGDDPLRGNVGQIKAALVALQLPWRGPNSGALPCLFHWETQEYGPGAVALPLALCQTATVIIW